MAYEVSWYQTDRVIYFSVGETLAVDELIAAIEFIQDGVRNAPGIVHLIIDPRDSKSIPSNVLEIKNHVTYLNRDKMGWILLVGAHPLVNVFVKVLTQLLGSKYRNFRGLKLALAFLVEQDETLSDLADRVVD
jgi:hypothetical protein